MTLLRLTQDCGWQGGCPALFTRPGGGFVVQGPEVDTPQSGTGETAVEVPGSVLLEVAAGQDQPMSLEEFGALFGSFRHSAFRLETLSRYSVDVEEEPFRRFVSQQPMPPMREWEAGRRWLDVIAQATAEGRRWQKVHLIRGPLTDYLRFELWTYAQTAEAGEEIGIIHVGPGDAPELGREDFWFFDDETVVRMVYDREGRFLGPVAVTGPEVAVYRYRRDVALGQSTPLATYAATVPSGGARSA